MYPFGMYDGYGLGYGLGMIPSAPQPPAFKTEGHTDAFVNHYEESGIDPTVALLSFTALSALGGLLIARKFNKTTKIVDNVTQKWTAAAKERAGKITAEATDKAAAHIEGAKVEAAAHAEGVKAEAENHAAGIVSDAEARAKGLTDEAEATKAEAARLRTEAEDAKASAEAYKNVTSTMAEADRDMAAKNLRSTEFAKKAATDGLKKAREAFAKECAERDAEFAKEVGIVQDSIAQSQKNLEELEASVVEGNELLIRKQEAVAELEKALTAENTVIKDALQKEKVALANKEKELLEVQNDGLKKLEVKQAEIDAKQAEVNELKARVEALSRKLEAHTAVASKDLAALRTGAAQGRAFEGKADELLAKDVSDAERPKRAEDVYNYYHQAVETYRNYNGKNPYALYHLGNLVEQGKGCMASPIEALSLHKNALEQLVPIAQHGDAEAQELVVQLRDKFKAKIDAGQFSPNENFKTLLADAESISVRPAAPSKPTAAPEPKKPSSSEPGFMDALKAASEGKMTATELGNVAADSLRKFLDRFKSS